MRAALEALVHDRAAGDAALRRRRPHARDRIRGIAADRATWRGADFARYAKRPAIFVLQAEVTRHAAGDRATTLPSGALVGNLM